MKRLLFLVVTIILLLSLAVSAQSVYIKPSSIKKRDKFKTTLTLMKEEKVKGKLSGLTDSSLFMVVRQRSEIEDQTWIFENTEYHFADIYTIVIKHSSVGPEVAGGILGFGGGFLLGTLFSAATKDLNNTPAIVGMAIGPVVGVFISHGAKKKYTFSIDSNYDNFKFHHESMKKMAIDQDEYQ
jgi:hypothetical protein